MLTNVCTVQQIEDGVQTVPESQCANTSDSPSSKISDLISQSEGHSSVKENAKLSAKKKIVECDVNSDSRSESNIANIDNLTGKQEKMVAERSDKDDSRGRSDSSVNCSTVASDKNVEKNGGTSESKKSSLKSADVKNLNLNKEEALGSKPSSLKDIGSVSEGENSLNVASINLPLATPTSTPLQAGLSQSGKTSIQSELQDPMQRLSVDNLTTPSAPVQTAPSAQAQTTPTTVTTLMVESSAPPLIDLDTVPASRSGSATVSRVAPTLETVVYPKLDSRLEGELVEN